MYVEQFPQKQHLQNNSGNVIPQLSHSFVIQTMRICKGTHETMLISSLYSFPEWEPHTHKHQEKKEKKYTIKLRQREKRRKKIGIAFHSKLLSLSLRFF